MPIRMLRDWTDSEAVNSIPVSAEVLFVRLIMKADDYGRFSANPKLLRALCFPLRDGVKEADIVKDLAACERAGLLFTYDSQGKRFLEIVNFGQRLRNSREKYPPPQTGGQNQQSAATSGDFRQVAAESGDFRPELNGREENTKAGATCSETVETDGSEPTALTEWTFPIKAGDKQPREWILTQKTLDHLKAAFDGLNIEAELRKAQAWCETNPVKRKTKDGMPKFLFNWMKEANNSGHGLFRTNGAVAEKKSTVPPIGAPKRW